MIYRVLANLVVLSHLGFIFFVIFGGLLAFRWRFMPWLHLPAVAWAAAVQLFGWICPLTPLENALRRAGGAAGYTGGFFDHYTTAIIYPTPLTREFQVLLGWVVVALNLAVYLAVWRRRHHRPGGA